MTKRVDLGGRQQLLDVGGGSGAYTLAFCAANPSLKATILDFPQTVETAKKYAQQSGLTDRVRHLWPETPLQRNGRKITTSF